MIRLLDALRGHRTYLATLALVAAVVVGLFTGDVASSDLDGIIAALGVLLGLSKGGTALQRLGSSPPEAE